MGRPGRIPSHEEEVVGRVHYRDQRAVASLARCLQDVVGPAPEGADFSVAVVCIGTDRSTGDALGPLVGTYLRRWAPQLSVYGTLEEPVHATNLSETLARLKAAAASFVLAVDACLGRAENVGYVTLRVGPLRPGSGVRKSLPEVGHAHMVGVVNVGGFMEYLVLQNTRLGVVWPMARVMAAAIARAFAGVRAAPSWAALAGQAWEEDGEL
ncbi:MAG TPA: spore protease YyaC [Limnochordales bacterium]